MTIFKTIGLAVVVVLAATTVALAGVDRVFGAGEPAAGAQAGVTLSDAQFAALLHHLDGAGDRAASHDRTAQHDATRDHTRQHEADRTHERDGAHDGAHHEGTQQTVAATSAPRVTTHHAAQQATCPDAGAGAIGSHDSGHDGGHAGQAGCGDGGHDGGDGC